MPLKDRTARAAYHKAYMRDRLAADATFKAKHLARVRTNTANDRKAVATVLAAFRANGCRVCGELDACCLVAHHVDPSTKLFTIGRTTRRVPAVRAELAKCVCVCHNCHSKIHAGRVTCPLIIPAPL